MSSLPIRQVSNYINLLEEHTKRWISLSEDIQNAIKAIDVEKVTAAIEKRGAVIQSHMANLDRLTALMLEHQVPVSREEVLADLIAYLQSSEETRLNQKMQEVKSNFDRLRDLEAQIEIKAKTVPEVLKSRLLNMNKARPAVNAYKKNVIAGQSGYARFERKK